MGKVLNFVIDQNRYRNLAEKHAEKGDFFGALGFLFSARSVSENYQVIMDIAYLYSDMGLYDLSNKFWFLYIDKAPKDKISIAYEELAINYFYLDNFWTSSFYFHKKLDVDGHISKEGLDQEIIDFFSGEELRKSAYRLVYPFERADYSHNIKTAKHFLAIGAFNEAKKQLENIPYSIRSEETSGELALASYMTEDFETAEKVCRQSLEINGENVIAYCHLSTVCSMKKDIENAEFYYQKALQSRKSAKGEEYNLATCAIERGDHKTANQCLEKIVEERPYEISMRFFYGISFLNLYEYQKAYEQFKYSLMINPDDNVVYFYLNLAKELSDGEQKDAKILPLKYEKELPKKVVKRYIESIRKIALEPVKIIGQLKKKEVRQMIEWALFCSEGQVTRDALFILSTCNNPYCIKTIKNTLLDPEIREETKRVLIYIFIAMGRKEKFGVTVGNFYLKIKPKKLDCERAEDGEIYFSAYALCMARVVFWESENLDIIGTTIDRIFHAFSGIITEADVTNEELAGFLLSECKFKWVKNEKDVKKLFDISTEKLHKLQSIYRGEKND